MRNVRLQPLTTRQSLNTTDDTKRHRIMHNRPVNYRIIYNIIYKGMRFSLSLQMAESGILLLNDCGVTNGNKALQSNY